MRKITVIFIVLLLLLSGLISISAEVERRFLLAGAATVEGGRTYVVTVKIDGTNIYGCQAILEYDPEQLELKGAVLIQNEFTEEWSYQEMEGLPEGEIGFVLVLDDTKLENPISQETGIINISFTVKEELEDGTKVNIRLKEQVITYDEEIGDVKPEDVEFKFTVIKKVLSNNDYLKSLNVTNGTLVPSFNKNTLNYTVSVPYYVTKLQFTALCEDEKSTMQVVNPDLVEGGKTNVTITVTSEAGTKRVYTIQVTRAAKPEEPKSSNNKLESLEADYPLSPLFHPDITEYTMEVPNEVTEIILSITTQDTKCTYVVEGGMNLVAGENTVTVVCTAEDGSVRNYVITVTRQEGQQETPSPTDEEPTDSPGETTEPTQPAETPGVIVISDPKGMPYWLVIVLIIIFTGVGFMFGVTINIKGAKEYNDVDDDDNYIESNIVESDFGRKETPKKKERNTLFIIEDSFRDDDK
ncbi:MAG: hypothetical protein GX166_02865 [Clostridiaceae bacterium]|nr:hypothetical protein [Clostridiaceae bacterium]